MSICCWLTKLYCCRQGLRKRATVGYTLPASLLRTLLVEIVPAQVQPPLAFLLALNEIR